VLSNCLHLVVVDGTILELLLELSGLHHQLSLCLMLLLKLLRYKLLFQKRVGCLRGVLVEICIVVIYFGYFKLSEIFVR